MKVVIDKQVLATMTSRIHGGLSDKNFAHLTLKTLGKDNLQLSLRDRVVAIYCNGTSVNEKEGVAFVQAKLFSDMVRELPAGDVQISVEGKAFVIVTAGKKKEFVMKLPLIEDMKWQKEPEIAPASEELVISSSKLSYIIEQVQFCINQDSPRNYGTVGFLHKPSPNKLRLVGTDGFRLSYSEIEDDNIPKDFLKESGVCISKRGLIEILRMSNEGFETVRLSISEDFKTLSAKVDGYQIYLLLSSLNFPNYQGVIPEYKPSTLSVSCQSLQGVVRRVLLASDKNRTLKMTLKKGNLTLSSRNVGNFEGYENLGLEGYEGPFGDLSINGKFLTDVISATMSDNINIMFNNDDNPVLLIPVTEPQKCRSQHVLVPIKEGN